MRKEDKTNGVVRLDFGLGVGLGLRLGGGGGEGGDKRKNRRNKITTGKNCDEKLHVGDRTK